MQPQACAHLRLEILPAESLGIAVELRTKAVWCWSVTQHIHLMQEEQSSEQQADKGQVPLS